MRTWKIWRRSVNDKMVTQWFETAYSVKARTNKEAQSRVKRKFENGKFHEMQLVAVEEGNTPL